MNKMRCSAARLDLAGYGAYFYIKIRTDYAAFPNGTESGKVMVEGKI